MLVDYVDVGGIAEVREDVGLLLVYIFGVAEEQW